MAPAQENQQPAKEEVHTKVHAAEIHDSDETFPLNKIELVGAESSHK